MDLIGPLVSLAIGLLLVLACGAFVAAEFSLITVNRNDVEAAAESGDKRAGGVLRGMKTLSTRLSGARLGITVTNLGIGFLAEPAIAALVGPPLVDAGLSEVAARSASVALALVLATGMTMIFGELVPKNMAIAQPRAPRSWSSASNACSARSSPSRSACSTATRTRWCGRSASSRRRS
uniref:CNNM domain-containing protein n=1 Tax=Brachybacterium sp. GPGPB12 TaxID=3023517 RepID=UPI004049A454